jgi:hypothetical protein
MVSLLEFSSCLKGILPANHSFQGGDRLSLLQVGLFS